MIEKDKDPNKELLKRIKADYKLAIEHPDWVQIRKQAELDDRALSIKGPWKDEDIAARSVPGEERPCIHLDQLSQYVNALVNEARSNPISIKAEPAGGKANEKTAKLREDRIRAIEYESNATAARMTAFENMSRHGFGAYGIDVEYKSWDDFRQVIRYKEFLNSYSCLWDPNSLSRNWSDMRFWFDLYRVTKEDYEEEYPDATPSLEFGTDYITSSWSDDTTVQIARYWYQERKKVTMLLVEAPEFPGKPFKVFKEKISKGVKLPDGSEVTIEGYKITSDAIVLKDGTQWKIVDQRVTMEPKIYHCLTNGVDILKEPELWPGKWIPRFPLIGKQHFEKVGNRAQRVVESYIRKGRDGNMLFDFYATKEAEDVSMIGVGPYKAAIGQIDDNIDQWQDAHKKPRGVLLYNPTPDSVPNGVVLPPPTRDMWTPNTQITEVGKESTRRAIQAAIGSYGVTRLDDTNVKSGIAMERLKQQNDMGSYHFMDALKTMIMHDGEVANDLLDNIETDNMEVGIVDVSGNRSVKRINDGSEPNAEDPNQYKLTDEDQHEITISTGRSYQSQREEDAEIIDGLINNLQNIGQIVGPQIAQMILAMGLKKRQLGPDFDEIINALAPKQNGQIDPKAVMAEVQKWMALAEQLGEKVKYLELEKQTKLFDIASKEKMHEQDIMADLTKAEITTAAQKDAERTAFIQEIILALQAHEHAKELTSAQMMQQAQQQPAQEQQLMTEQPEVKDEGATTQV